LLISDFYYLDSAENLKIELTKKTKLEGFAIKKINNKKYRLYIGPFQNFNSLKSTYISLNKLGFDELRIYKK
jgi:cell division protein FtsN